jgi:hypothetical protein
MSSGMGGDNTDTTSQRSFTYMTPNSRQGGISRKSELEDMDAPNTDDVISHGEK